MGEIRLNESELIRVIKRIINENDDDFVTGISASERTELIDDVMMSGMDPNYEITRNGKCTGEMVIDLITY